jgi:predicted methyltransferase
MRDRSPAWIVAASLLVLAPFMAVAADGEKPDVTGAPAELNRNFIDPELDVDTWVERFEGESREVFSSRHDVLQATGVRAGDRVADIGAGTGLYTRLFAEAVGKDGWVHAVDIGPGFLQHINRTVAAAGLGNVTAVLGRIDSITLPVGSVDLAFLCDTYHHLEAVEPTLASIHRALVRGGRLVVVDFERIPGQSREWLLDHMRAGKDEFRREIEAAGFSFVEEVEIPGFEENYFLRFKKK